MTEVLEALGVGTYDAWWALWGAPTKVAAVAAPDDDGTSGIGAQGSATVRQSFTLSPSAIPPGSTINSVSIRGRFSRDNPGATFAPFLRLAGTNQDGPSTDPGTPWVTLSFTIARPGGGSWSLADLSTLEIGAYADSGAYDWISTLEAVVDYTPPTATTGAMLLLF